MDDLEEFCRRVLGPVPAVRQTALYARRGGGDRITQLTAAARLCRDLPAERPAAVPEPEAAGSLADAVAAEMASATAQLPERQREALALRDLLRLSYAQVAEVMSVEPAAVAPLLARARLRLRAARRGTEMLPGDCQERDRALRLLARRQDSEALATEDDSWLRRHLPGCASCAAAHAAMLEASVCYRSWPRADSR